jgi:protocatechuate 3,4-dioxygenase beta subunit
LAAINSDRETDMSDPYDRPMFEEIILPRRTPTRLNAMGSFKLARRAGDIRDGSAPQTPAPKVMIGPQAFPRCDITEGKPGIPLTLTLTVVDAENGLAPIEGANVEIWHCDADGVFSDYASKPDPDAATTTYLRGTQTTTRVGQVTFTTIYPGWSGDRATHMFVRIYDGMTPRKTLQLGFPDAINATVYADVHRYVRGQSPITSDADPVFGDAPESGAYGGRREFQIVAVAGDNAVGYVATARIAVRM